MFNIIETQSINFAAIKYHKLEKSIIIYNFILLYNLINKYRSISNIFRSINTLWFIRLNVLYDTE